MVALADNIQWYFLSRLAIEKARVIFGVGSEGNIGQVGIMVMIGDKLVQRIASGSVATSFHFTFLRRKAEIGSGILKL